MLVSVPFTFTFSDLFLLPFLLPHSFPTAPLSIPIPMPSAFAYSIRYAWIVSLEFAWPWDEMGLPTVGVAQSHPRHVHLDPSMRQWHLQTDGSSQRRSLDWHQ